MMYGLSFAHSLTAVSIKAPGLNQIVFILIICEDRYSQPAQEDTPSNFRQDSQRRGATHSTPRFTSRRYTLFRYGGVIFDQAEKSVIHHAKARHV